MHSPAADSEVGNGVEVGVQDLAQTAEDFVTVRVDASESDANVGRRHKLL